MSGGFPRTTVVVPARNAEDEIGRCVTALLAQDAPREAFRVVVVDNLSTDGTGEVARRAGAEVVREYGLASSYAARNRGIEVSDGEWVAFTDADCVPEPTWLRRLLDPPPPAEVGAVVGEVAALESETAVQRLTERHGIMRHAVTLPHKALPCFSTASVAVRRSLLLDLGGFRQDVRYFADMELSWRMQIERDARILFRPEARVLHRHRRTWGAFWRQAVQHGRGVAFMRRTYPDRYRFSVAEQVRRLGTLARSASSAVLGDGLDSGRPGTDRAREPVWLALWYGGLLAGYLRGPAWTPGAARRDHKP